MKIFNLLSWIAKWPFTKTLVGEQFLANQLHSYAKAKAIIKRITLGLGIAIAVIMILLITLMVLLIIHLAR